MVCPEHSGFGLVGATTGASVGAGVTGAAETGATVGGAHWSFDSHLPFLELISQQSRFLAHPLTVKLLQIKPSGSGAVTTPEGISEGISEGILEGISSLALT